MTEIFPVMNMGFPIFLPVQFIFGTEFLWHPDRLRVGSREAGHIITAGDVALAIALLYKQVAAIDGNDFTLAPFLVISGIIPNDRTFLNISHD